VHEGKTLLYRASKLDCYGIISQPQFGHRLKVAVRSMLALGLATEETVTRRLRQGLGAIMDIAEFPLQV
jgi:hypothetical protein